MYVIEARMRGLCLLSHKRYDFFTFYTDRPHSLLIVHTANVIAVKVPILLFFKIFLTKSIVKPKKISASKYAFLTKKVRNLCFDPERPGTGTCDIAAVRRPSLSLVFDKEKRDKQST